MDFHKCPILTKVVLVTSRDWIIPLDLNVHPSTNPLAGFLYAGLANIPEDVSGGYHEVGSMMMN
jgi:hypothetical protein